LEPCVLGPPDVTCRYWGALVLILCLPDFPHEHAPSRAYRWGEDGIAGVCDSHGIENIAFAFWNEKECVGELRDGPHLSDD